MYLFLFEPGLTDKITFKIARCYVFSPADIWSFFLINKTKKDYKNSKATTPEQHGIKELYHKTTKTPII